MATSDGGGSWTRQYAGHANLDQVDFIDGQHGWAAGGDTLLRTTDGGASWTALAEPCQGELNSVHFVSPTLGYAVAAAPGDQAPAAPTRTPSAARCCAPPTAARPGYGPSARRQPAERLLRQRR